MNFCPQTTLNRVKNTTVILILLISLVGYLRENKSRLTGNRMSVRKSAYAYTVHCDHGTTGDKGHGNYMHNVLKNPRKK